MSDSISDSSDMDVSGVMVEWDVATAASIAHSGTLIGGRWVLSIADTDLLDEVGTAAVWVVSEDGGRARADFRCSWVLRPLPLGELRLRSSGASADPALVLHRLPAGPDHLPQPPGRPPLAVAVARPERGAPLLLEATPFAHPLLLNAWARGNVAAVAGPLFLADAAAAPGCQGAPVFLCREGERRQLLGLVLAPTAYWRGQPFHCAVALALAGIRLEADALLPFHFVVSPHRGPVALPRTVEGVVRVASGGGWGAGVHLGGGLVLTCSHVVSKVLPAPLTLTHPLS
ncbi:peroxisomal leader peptide-processing protease-like [Schistocerca cancellata]|uniref:peroxisomal leader peptide-processing protease-like n=1 Tax=Schistocerca cancellata TaxID=274614 RepID=UPI002117EAA4|nr:peroxisomal leader peptide-processing protease-like [Schistocerca cancellata]